MLSSPLEQQALQQLGDLEAPVRAVEDRLTALGLALHRQDAQAVEREASALHTALATALQHFREAARHGAVPAPLRQRLVLASGQVAAQREALARATAALDRAMDVLLPEAAGRLPLYAADGLAGRHAGGGGLMA
jgi:hypothetical protein